MNAGMSAIYQALEPEVLEMFAAAEEMRAWADEFFALLLIEELERRICEEGE